MNVRCHSSSFLMLVLFSLLLCSLPSACQSSSANKKPSEILATVDGQPIYADDLLPYIQAQLLPLRQQEYELKAKALDGVIDVKLVEIEAKKRGISTENLLRQEADSKVVEPTESELYALYIVQKDQLGKSFAEVKAPLAKLLRNAKIQEARDAYFKQLRANAAISVLLTKPTVEVASDRKRLRGNPDAQLTIVEFSDFQCPYCRSVEPALKAVLEKYKGRVNLAYHDLPLREIHPQAQLAAEASRCAAEQGKFWEYHDLLFEHQDKLGRGDLVEHARTLNLDEKKFDLCLSSGKYKDFIEQERQLGMKAGITGTPGFLINGNLLTGNLPESSFDKFIQEALGSVPKQQAAAR
ncbi:MAG: thioredoxin domain-containing protein [Acidobacteriaceae bacterium]